VKKRIAIDFDGVIHDYSDGWTGVDPQGDPIPGSREFIEEKLAEGYEVAIHSCRAALHGDRCGTLAIIKWLDRHGFPRGCGVSVTDKKPHAHCYIDDRAIRFRGNWDEVRRAMEEPLWYEATQ
jgi:hypothetical protein